MLNSSSIGFLTIVFAAVFCSQALAGGSASNFTGVGNSGRPGGSGDYNPKDIHNVEMLVSNPKMMDAHMACSSVSHFENLKLDEDQWLPSMLKLSEDGHRPCAEALIKEFGTTGTDRPSHHHQSKRSSGGSGGSGGKSGKCYTQYQKCKKARGGSGGRAGQRGSGNRIGQGGSRNRGGQGGSGGSSGQGGSGGSSGQPGAPGMR